MVCHSEKEQTAPTYKHIFGYHPMVAFSTTPGRRWRDCCARGNAGVNTAADHTSLLDAVLAQISTPTSVPT